MLLPMFAILPVSAADAAAAADAKSFIEPVNAGSDKYYTTKTLQTVDFTKIKSDAELAAAEITYLDASASDSYGVSYVDDGVHYYSQTNMGFLLSNIDLSDSTKSYVVDFTFKANPTSWIFEASAAFPDLSTINTTVGTAVDGSAFKIRPYSGKNLGIDSATYYSDATCSTSLGGALDSSVDTAVITDKKDVRVKLLITDGTWEYGEVSVDGKTYYVKATVRTGWTGYFGFRCVGNTNILLKNLTISECAKDATDSATVVSCGNSYRVAAGTVIDYKVYNKSAVLMEVDGDYSMISDVTAVAGKTYNILAQDSNVFVTPIHVGTTRYYTKKVLQSVDFTQIKNDSQLAAAGMTYLDAVDGDAYGVSYLDDGMRYCTNTDMGFLLSNVQFGTSTTKSYMVDFTFKGNPQYHILEASAAFADKTTLSESVRTTVNGAAFKIRLKDTNLLSLDSAKYYSDSACTTEIGSNPDEAAQSAAYDDKADVRVKLLFTGGSLQYGEVIVDGKTYYVKMNSAKSGQTGYFGFLGISDVDIVLKNLTISECAKYVASATPTHAFVKSGNNVYRVSQGQPLNAANCAVYNPNAIAVEVDGEYYTSKSTESGKTYTIKSVEPKSAGASARLKTDSGLRFATSVDKNTVAMLDTLKADSSITSYNYGTIITLAKYAEELNNKLTHETLDAFAAEKGINNSYVDVKASDWYAETDDSYVFVGSIVSIDSKNYTREYASVGYVTITKKDGSEVTVYADYVPVNARSVSYVAACAYYDKSVSYNDTQTQILTTFIGDRKYYPLAIDGVSEYTVVYDADDTTAKSLATQIRDAFAAAGVTVPLKADTSSVSGKGIYIGATSHTLSKASTAYYLNCQVGADASGNIAVTGYYESGVARILEKISGMSESSTTTLLLEDNFMGYFAKEGYANVPKYEGAGASGATVNTTFEGYNSYYVQISGVTETDFNNYIAKLEAEGYTRDDDFTSRNGNPARVYTNGDALVTVSYIKYSSSSYNYDSISGSVAYISIGVNTVESSGVLTRDTTGGVCDLQVTLIGTECGYIIRLTNGHFVIVDGGLKEYNYDFIYEQLVAQNVLDGKPVIEAWFFTHPHTDHVGSYLQFAKTYSGNVELQSIVQHFPQYERYDTECTTDGGGKEGADVPAGMKNNSASVFSYTKQYFPKAKIVTAYRGQRFAFAGVTFDVFFTSENLYDSQMINTNSSSVVYQLTFSDSQKKMLILGDMYYDGCQLLNLIYGSGLASDVVQVAHHGYNGGNADMYKKVNATYAFWTNSYQAVYVDSNRGGTLVNLPSTDTTYNHVIKGVEAATNFKYHIIPTDSQNTGTPVILKWGMTKSELQAMGAMTPAS